MVRAMFRDDVHGWVPARGPCDPRARGSGGHLPARDGRRVQAGTLTRRAVAARAAVGSAASLWRARFGGIFEAPRGVARLWPWACQSGNNSDGPRARVAHWLNDTCDRLCALTVTVIR